MPARTRRSSPRSPRLPAAAEFALPLLYGLHVAMGAAAGGVGLATGNLGLKLAPQGQGTSYLAATSPVASVTGGNAPLVGGALAHWVRVRRFVGRSIGRGPASPAKPGW